MGGGADRRGGADVFQGDQTWQEMMGGFIQYTLEDPAEKKPTARGAGN